MSALQSSINSEAALLQIALKKRSPFSADANSGLPIQVSLLTLDHCRSAHTHPSENAFILNFLAPPLPHYILERIKSDFRYSIKLVSITSAWSPFSLKNTTLSNI